VPRICPFPVLLILAFCAFTWAPAPALTAASAAQPQYVKVVDAAKARNLAPSWVKRDDLLLLSRGSARILLKMNSRQAQINGVRVWLLYPVVQRDGWVRIASRDLEVTLDPLLAPKRAAKTVRTVCLDPGHGGRDPGFRSGSRHEKTYTLLLAKEVRDALQKQNIKVVLTRSTDYYLDLEARPALAARRGADLFVSLHFNAAGSGSSSSVKGTEVFALTPRGAPSTSTGDTGGNAGSPGNRYDDRNLLLAYNLQKALVSGLGSEDRGVQRARFAVLREAAMPAVLIEAGFMSNPGESRRIFDSAYRKRIAKAIADGIVAYKRVSDPKGT